eukprot:832692-Prymnesium_polylepis.1
MELEREATRAAAAAAQLGVVLDEARDKYSCELADAGELRVKLQVRQALISGAEANAAADLVEMLGLRLVEVKRKLGIAEEMKNRLQIRRYGAEQEELEGRLAEAEEQAAHLAAEAEREAQETREARLNKEQGEADAAERGAQEAESAANKARELAKHKSQRADQAQRDLAGGGVASAAAKKRAQLLRVEADEAAAELVKLEKEASRLRGVAKAEKEEARNAMEKRRLEAEALAKAAEDAGAEAP